jgi:hypothetical protein
MPSAHILLLREQLRRRVREVSLGQCFVARPRSAQMAITGQVVEVNDLAIALETLDVGVVWVHAEDCPALDQP